MTALKKSADRLLVKTPPSDIQAMRIPVQHLWLKNLGFASSVPWLLI